HESVARSCDWKSIRTEFSQVQHCYTVVNAMWKSSLFSTSLREHSLLQGTQCVGCKFHNTVFRSRPYLRHYASKANDRKPASTSQKSIQFKQNSTPTQPRK